jgi:hypothetical protein
MNNITQELMPFLDKIRSTPQDRLVDFKDSYFKFIARTERSSKIIESLIFSQPLSEDGALGQQVYDLFFYLGLVESFGNCFVDLLVMLIIANGRDFHIESMYSSPRIRHVNSMIDLEKEKVPLTTKLNFLRDNGIDTFSSVIDSKLRNDIAHLNLEIVENNIVIRGKLIEDFFNPCFDRLMTATTRVSILINKLALDLGWETKSLTELAEK